MASMDRLVELFVQSAQSGEDGEPTALKPLPADGGRLDAEGVERGVASIDKMLNSDDGIKMGANSAGTFVCLAMALEEKPLLQAGAVRCYEKALEYLERRRKRRGDEGGSWERAVVTQQLGMVCLKQNNGTEAVRWLEQCADECTRCEGHPREAVLFDGAFNTKQTRLDFVGMVESLLAKVYKALGNETRARQHGEEVLRLSRMQSGDAVERAASQGQISEPSANEAGSSKMTPKELWAATPVEDRRLKEYRFMDEGPTVSLILDLNDHLGIGDEASNAVETLSQFKVNCKDECLDVLLRLQCEDKKVYQFRLLLEPLIHEIIPEDTVPKLKGREGKRRLEVKLFKRDKQQGWRNDFVKTIKSSDKSKADEKSSKVTGASKGTMLNPLSDAEIAKLPRPSCTGGDNRPSTWNSGPVLLHKEKDKGSPNVAVQKDQPTPSCASTANGIKEPAAAPTSTSLPSVRTTSQSPSWVARIEERKTDGGLEFDVHLGTEAGEGVSMADLELDVDIAAGLRLSLRGSADGPLVLSLPSSVDCDALQAKWRRKTRVLELRLPSV